MSLGMLGKKMGMTQLFDEEGNIVPSTVLTVGPCRVIQRKRVATDGYEAVQVGYGDIKKSRLAKAMEGHFKAGGGAAYRYLREFRVGADSPLDRGAEITVGRFKIGDRVHVSGVSKGKGFQGVIKRHHKAGGPASHGSRFHRAPGSIGQRTSPGETFKNMKLPGHMGTDRVTVKGLTVVRVLLKERLIFVKGAVPGPRGRVVEIVNVASDVDSRGEP